MSSSKIIYTIGHSTRSEEAFLSLLKIYKIELLADIRTFPGSNRYPQFNKENLEKILPQNHIAYKHLLALGGRRKAMKNSKNTAWKNVSFRGYADYMETDEFKNGIEELEKIASQKTTAYMCSEAVWWRCHRSMVSDYLKWKGWKVMHIISENKLEEHPYTSVAKIIAGKLTYQNQNELQF